jgi:hypothetical protein
MRKSLICIVQLFALAGTITYDWIMTRMSILVVSKHYLRPISILDLPKEVPSHDGAL